MCLDGRGKRVGCVDGLVVGDSRWPNMHSLCIFVYYRQVVTIASLFVKAAADGPTR